MTRFVFSLAFSVILARWMYAEVAMMAPGMIPLIDYGMERVSIPTHDQWSKEPFVDALAAIEDVVQNYQPEDWKNRLSQETEKPRKKFNFDSDSMYSPAGYSPSDAPYYLRAGSEYVYF